MQQDWAAVFKNSTNPKPRKKSRVNIQLAAKITGRLRVSLVGKELTSKMFKTGEFRTLMQSHCSVSLLKSSSKGINKYKSVNQNWLVSAASTSYLYLKLWTRAGELWTLKACRNFTSNCQGYPLTMIFSYLSIGSRSLKKNGYLTLNSLTFLDAAPPKSIKHPLATIKELTKSMESSFNLRLLEC